MRSEVMIDKFRILDVSPGTVVVISTTVWRKLLRPSSGWKIKATGFSGKLINFYQTTRHYISEGIPV
jgi:hypothetical protein